MSENPENLKKIAKEHSEKLAKLGTELGKNQFSYKIENKPSKEYWQKKIENFKKYSKKGLEYYNQTYSLMNLVTRPTGTPHTIVFSASEPPVPKGSTVRM